jgi:hypothetical protein
MREAAFVFDIQSTEPHAYVNFNFRTKVEAPHPLLDWVASENLYKPKPEPKPEHEPNGTHSLFMNSRHSVDTAQPARQHVRVHQGSAPLESYLYKTQDQYTSTNE